MTASAPSLPPEATAATLRATGAASITAVEPVQALWSGYGQIVRCRLVGAPWPSVIVKHVRWPRTNDHPRGWATDRSHARKVRSYEVESHFYEHYAPRCTPQCRVPACRSHSKSGDEVFLVLEDLDAAGFAGRRRSVTDAELSACLRWLAHFHATFLGQPPDGLWPVGTYWHLATRLDELAAMPPGPLRDAAAVLDGRLSAARFQTLVHGDAKLANFCFSNDGTDAAAVDFQYVGGGCGIKDVAYFLGSCLDESECERRETALLDEYFGWLREATGPSLSAEDFAALQTEWRTLYPVAWTDFFRFLSGWSPGHWKIHGYSKRLAAQVLATC